jgi:hypothetical protein
MFNLIGFSHLLARDSAIARLIFRKYFDSRDLGLGTNQLLQQTRGYLIDFKHQHDDFKNTYHDQRGNPLSQLKMATSNGQQELFDICGSSSIIRARTVSHCIFNHQRNLGLTFRHTPVE